MQWKVTVNYSLLLFDTTHSMFSHVQKSAFLLISQVNKSLEFDFCHLNDMQYENILCGVDTYCFLGTYTLGMLEKYIKCLDFIARHNISSTLPLKCIRIEKNRKKCCALICGH